MLLTDARRLGAYLRLLWDLDRPLLPMPPGSGPSPFLSPLGIHLPEGSRAWSLAAAAHVGAHLAHGRGQLPWSSRKPITRALIGLLEDARAEGLAMRAYPGLRRLWRPFHVAGPGDGGGFPTLLARLAHALFDDAHADPHPWIAKGRRLFAEAGGADAEPDVLARAASHLGNDIGQMRLQFNDRDHIVQPGYRDDNRWLWEAETEEDLEASPPAPSDEAAGGGGPAVATDAESIARYPEWDLRIRRSRPAWCTVHERRMPASAPPTPCAAADHRLQRVLRERMATTRLRRPRERDGDGFDTGALLDAAIARRTYLPVDDRVHVQAVHHRTPLALLVLLDASASTAEAFAGSHRSVLSIATEMTNALATSCGTLGIPCSVHAFRSSGREAVDYLRIADAPAPWDAHARGRLAVLGSARSTRLGAALRHATARWRGRNEPHRLILLLTDGEPHDVDVHDRRYLAEDARRAVDEARLDGVRVGAIGLAPDCAPVLRRMLGPAGWIVPRRATVSPAELARVLAGA